MINAGQYCRELMALYYFIFLIGRGRRGTNFTMNKVGLSIPRRSLDNERDFTELGYVIRAGEGVTIP